MAKVQMLVLWGVSAVTLPSKEELWDEWKSTTGSSLEAIYTIIAKYARKAVAGAEHRALWRFVETEAYQVATFNGGYETSREQAVFRHGMQTAFSILRAEASRLAPPTPEADRAAPRVDELEPGAHELAARVKEAIVNWEKRVREIAREEIERALTARGERT